MTENTIVAPQKMNSLREIFDRQCAHQYLVAQSTFQERIGKLKKLHSVMLELEHEIEAALWADFKKPPLEVSFSEIGVVNTEIRHAIRNLRSWMAPRRVSTPLILFGSRSEIRYEPKGVCLVISPWNFPVNLALTPLVTAVAAGNCVIIRPSEHTPHSTAIIRKIVGSGFSEDEVAVAEGDAIVARELLTFPFNHIFFTGSPAVGKIVMRAAADHLSSVTLELGGKSPVVVDETCDLSKAAASIAFVNGLNAGQICIAPDYVLVQEDVKAAFLDALKGAIERMYGSDAKQRQDSKDLCRMVNGHHFNRVKGLLDDAVRRGGRVVVGGYSDAEENYIEPTVLESVPLEARIWEEEIFGPLLPVRTFKRLEEAISIIRGGERPLSMYIFSADGAKKARLMEGTRCGGTVVNDCAIHFYNNHLPFGGVNNSGIGKAHGYFGFQEFSNARGVTRQNTIFPLTRLFHPPYGGFLVRQALNGIKRWL